MSMERMVVAWSELPKDRLGLVVGRHVVAEYRFVGRNQQHNSHPHGYRVMAEVYPHGAFHLFSVDRYDETGSRPIGSMCSFPSPSDCNTLWQVAQSRLPRT